MSPYYPDRQEFLKRAQRGNMTPVYKEILADMETPVSAFKKIGGGEYSFLLESVEGGERMARFSFLGSGASLVLRSKGNLVEIDRCHGVSPTSPNPSFARRGEGTDPSFATRGEGTEPSFARREDGIASPLEKGGLRGVSSASDTPPTTVALEPGRDVLHVLKEELGRLSYVPDPDLPRFCGGAVGFIGYDMVRFFEDLPDSTTDDLSMPDCTFLFTDTLLIFDHVRHRIRIVCNARIGDGPDAAYDEAIAKIESVQEQLRKPVDASFGVGNGHKPEITSNFTREGFEQAVRDCKEYIAAGDVIQVVLSQRFSTRVTADSFDVYRALRSLNPSPYMYYLSYGDTKLIGSSPEILVTEERGKVTVRPIAGTRPRGATQDEDEALEAELLKDEKERAEHIMLVDLGRNDIGRVCRYGTVEVDELMVIERYSHVMHIVSNVKGRLRVDADQYDLLRACFPAGTVSGAPKIRAMEIIDELEPTRRGSYAGSIGYFSYSGDMDTCITIRTILIQGDTAYVQAGAGIVADSDPAREYQETQNKAMAMIRAIEMAESGLE